MGNQESKLSHFIRSLQNLRRKGEVWSAAHPVKSSLPFLGLTAVILTGSVLATSCTLCYTVDAQGKTVTYIQNQETYSAAVTKAEEKTSRILDTDYAFTQEVTLRTTLAPKDQVEELPQATDSIMEIIPELEHVYTLTVDGTLVGAAESADVIQEALTLVTDHYTTPDTLSVTFDSQVNLRYEYLPVENGVSTPQELADLLLAESPRTFPYTVQAGDTLEGLLARFSMTQERLQDLNPEADLTLKTLAMGIEEAARNIDADDLAEVMASQFGTPLAEGLLLTVEQSCPLLVVSTVEEQTLLRATAPTLETQPDPTMFTGEQRIIQEGQTGEDQVLSRVVKRCGVTIASTDLNAVTLTEATPIIVGTGTQPKPELPEGCLFLWPVQGTISSDYGYRFIFGETNFHRGIDIPAPTGTAINAAADGVVTFAGERGTYGNLVILTHPGGFQTYYAHCSQLLVRAGDFVTQGQPVAAVGSTGRSTGPHVHFEVRYQNDPIDPLLYLPGENDAPAREEVTPEEEEEIPEPVVPETPVEPETPPVTETPAEPEVPAQPEETPAEPVSPGTQDPAQVPEEAALPPEETPET
ncbi:MAG: peptidoglycan DD-metalloendopeptidase family protein [Ruminiclostridium sp.]|nr:peptidoglycan DD-metalloendopeptidase family protein [Ruminiclostridium sp.]